MDTRHFHKQLDDALLRLVGETGVIVCAISGGADSMALFHGLVRTRELRKRDWTLHVAHLDHGIPHNSAEMMQFVQVAARKAGIPFHHDLVDVPALSRATNASIEEAGREVRYAFLERVCSEVGATALAVAHHADDQAETILHRILRGTGLRGLAGIPESRPLSEGCPARLVRPMLGFRRCDGVAYLKRRGLSFLHDDTNDDVLAATRNRIRHDVLPAIEREINPQAVTAIVRLGEIARQTAAWKQALAEEAYEQCCVEKTTDAISLDASHLSKERELIQAAVIAMAVERLDAGRGEIGFERLQAALGVIASERSGSTAEFPGGITISKRGRFVVVTRRPAADASAAPCRDRQGAEVQ